MRYGLVIIVKGSVKIQVRLTPLCICGEKVISHIDSISQTDLISSSGHLIRY